MAGHLRHGAARSLATTTQEKEDRCSTANRYERDYHHDVVHEVRNHVRFPYRDRKSCHMHLRAAQGYQTNELAGLVKVVFETDEAAGIDLGRQVKDRDRLKILLRARILDDPNLDGQGLSQRLHQSRTQL